MIPIMTIWMLYISIMDIRRRRVPVRMLVLGGILACAALAYKCRGGVAYGDILGGMLPGILLLAVALATKKAGYGDGIVLLFLGITAGGAKSLMLLGISLFLAAIFSIVLLMTRKAGKNTRIPYLPFLAAAWLVTVPESIFL